MNKILNFFILAGALTLIGLGFLPPKISSKFDYTQFGALPVQHDGRIKPIDTVARNTLLQLSGKQVVVVREHGTIHPTTWFMEMTMFPESAHNYPVFRIDNPEVLGLLGWTDEEGKYFSFNQLQPFFPTLAQQYQKMNPDPDNRSVFEQQLNKLYNALTLYTKTLYGLHPMGMLDSLTLEYASWVALIGPGMEAIRLQQEGKPFNEEALQQFAFVADHYLEVSKTSTLGIIPVATPEETWKNVGHSLLDAIPQGSVDTITQNYAQLISAYRQSEPDLFNTTLTETEILLAGHISLGKVKFEAFFNQFEPFYRSILLYIFAFVLILMGWLFQTQSLLRNAFYVLLLAFAVHTFGLAARTYIQARPPVTNLYSSAIFVGWGAVLFGLLLERFYRNGLGAAVATMVGSTTLVIAHHLGTSGDTLEQVRAVLDSNFWLSTHVVVVTLGYSAMFLAGALSIFGIFKSIFSRTLDKPFIQSCYSMIYGVICFATLFSFVGTMLGGIWADQSWGRFWGWDPKENGALLIVLWCAIMLHARWGKLVGAHGFMIMAVFGNIITSWSWFGTNMLSVGLHSYGFMDSAFVALLAFVLSQLAVMALGCVALYRSSSA